MKIQDDRVALRRVLGKLLHDQLPRARDALPVDVPPVVAPSILPEVRELVSAPHEGALRRRLCAAPPQREARKLEDLGVNRDFRARFESSGETQKPEGIGGPYLRRTEPVEPPLRKNHSLPEGLFLDSLDWQHFEATPFGEMLYHL